MDLNGKRDESGETTVRWMDYISAVGKLSVLVSTPIAIVILLSIAQEVKYQQIKDRAAEEEDFPVIVLELSVLADLLGKERHVFMGFLAGRSTGEDLNRVEAETDAKIQDVVELYYSHPVFDFGKVVAIRQLLHTRRTVRNKHADIADAFKGYSEIIHKVLLAAVHVGVAGNEPDAVEPLLLQHHVLALSNAYLLLEKASIPLLQSEDVQEAAIAIKNKVVRSLAFDVLEVLCPTDLLDTMLGALYSPFYTLLGQTWDRAAGAFSLPTAPSVPAAQWEEVHAEIEGKALAAAEQQYDQEKRTLGEIRDDASSLRLLHDVFVAFGVGSLVLVAGVVWVHHSNSAAEQHRAATLRTMVASINRVRNYMHHVAIFDLNVRSSPKSSLPSSTEMVLMHCIGALKNAAAAIPPSLFPERFVLSKDEKGEVTCPMEEMMLRLAPHDEQDDQHRYKLLTEDDVHASKAMTVMNERGKLGLKVRDATLITVDMRTLHGTVVSKGVATVQVDIVAFLSIIEGAVLEHRGLMHRVTGNSVIAHWNVSLPVPAHQVTASRCALSLGPRCTEFPLIPLAIALTSGEVVAGNLGFVPTLTAPSVAASDMLEASLENSFPFGNSMHEKAAFHETNPTYRFGMKTFEVIGPAVELGARVTTYQRLHNTGTAVLCDEVVASKVEHVFDIKPIELIRIATETERVTHRIFEVLETKQIDEQEARLRQYKAAFELFSRRRFTEADKAFRQYTKSFGYDSSVERLQTLISLKKAIDDNVDEFAGTMPCNG